MEPLVELRRSPLEPGTNLRGRVDGAAWAYLLPAQDLPAILCLGEPSRDAVARLLAIGRRVVVVPPARARARWRATAEEAGWDRLKVLDSVDAGAGRGGYDLVWEAAGAPRGPGIVALRGPGAAGPGGLHYREAWARRDRPARRPVTGAAGGGPGTLTVRLTPMLGEPRSAVPESDAATLAYFRSNGLDERWLRRELSRRGAPRAKAIARLAHPLELPGRLVVRRGRLSGPDVGAGPPRYLREVAAASGVDLGDHRWGLSARGDYPSQKSLFFLFPADDPRPRIVVKLSHDPRFGPLVENAGRGLRALEATDFGRRGRVPRVLFSGAAKSVRILGEEALAGAPFTTRSLATPGCPFAADAITALVELGAETASPTSPQEVAAALQSLVDRFRTQYPAAGGAAAFVARQVERLATTESPLPLVFMHGDPGPQNLVVGGNGVVRFLDWENAEPGGMPLWDVFHFLRGYSLWAGRRAEARSRLGAAQRHFLDGSPFTPLIETSIRRYVRAVGVDPCHVEPLFWTYLLVHAVRDAPRLEPDRAPSGHAVRLLQLLAERAGSPVLRRILQAEATA